MPAGSWAPSPSACASPGGAVDLDPWPSRASPPILPVEVSKPARVPLPGSYPSLTRPRPGAPQRCERPIGEGAADAPHQAQSIGEVVERGEAVGEQFARPEQVREVCPRVVAARLAGAVRIGRAGVVEKARVAQIEFPSARPELAIARYPSRQDAIEEVDPPLHRGEEVRRRTDPHQVANPRVVGECAGGRVKRLAHLWLAL